jgi:hypothetical protein
LIDPCVVFRLLCNNNKMGVKLDGFTL